MDNKSLVIYIREDDELQTKRKTENEDIVPQLNQQSCQIGKKIKRGQLLWKEFYNKELIQNKQKNPYATHNELTSIISKKWKKKKQHKKKVDKLKLKIKQEHITEYTIEGNNPEEMPTNHKQTDDIVEKIRIQTFKLIYLNTIFDLKGEEILEAIKDNMQFICINKSYENYQIGEKDFNKSKATQNNQEVQEKQVVQNQKDPQDEIVIDEYETNIKLLNKIVNYL
ncbi:unnamed protein product (macronuclear) [Paramecium tetraurelia]|uniref:HMG box domain-containing protein n=1 Tax=Paramecium tetraurelia TaxID=5888 RepID=A0BXM7_PARTE|nr:uncharacterized protein GSPATT00033147001 [Paramecium tetraurelia]CAK63294.1 unnamed protein product [Paramecium tetraurelia]|eukprot:XP_001430692.1 hypothetical protein (macronuclear) [Paramecium tetraurelia strain d4-2]